MVASLKNIKKKTFTDIRLRIYILVQFLAALHILKGKKYSQHYSRKKKKKEKVFKNFLVIFFVSSISKPNGCFNGFFLFLFFF